MAKAKKSGSDEATEKKPAAKAAKPAAAAETKAPAAKPAAGKKAAAAAKKPAPATQPTGTPMVDTHLAAQNAAKMLLNRSPEAAAPATEGAAKESAAFKSMKEQLAKPKPSGLSGLFGGGAGEKKGGTHNFLNQQKGHNQTFGGMNKTGVPRRTNG